MILIVIRPVKGRPSGFARGQGPRAKGGGAGAVYCLLPKTALQGRFEIADICLVSAFSKARSGLLKPRFFFLFFRGKSCLVEMDLYSKLVRDEANI